MSWSRDPATLVMVVMTIAMAVAVAAVVYLVTHDSDLTLAPVRVERVDTDVTDRRRMEAQLHRAERMESIGMLAGGVAHDLNNALAPILMAAELLREHVTDPEDRRFVDSIEASAQHGAALVQQLLAFARGSEGQRTSVDVPALLADVRTLLGSTLAKDIDLSVETVGTPWPIMAEVTKIKDLQYALVAEYVNRFGKYDDKGAADFIARWLAVDAKMTANRAQFVPVVGKVLPGVKAATFFQIDRRLQMLVDLSLAARLPVLQLQAQVAR